VNSSLIKNLIKKSNFNNRDYIDDLMDIELYVTGKLYGMWSGYKVNYLKETYPKEFKTIYKELDSKGFKQYLNQKRLDRQKERRLNEEYKKERKKEFQEAKSEWKKAGGKIGS